MPVDSKHSEYTRMADTWALMRTVTGGQPTVHAAGEKHLPKLAGETDKDYAARKGRALFFNATWRTIEGLRGMLFRKAPVSEVSTAAEAMLLDVTKSGVGLNELAFKVATECLAVGRVGLMVDYPKFKREPDAPPLTVAAVEALNLRPQVGLYQAESIINWRESWERNKTVLARVVLEESAAIPDPNDEFLETSEKRWRVLDLFAGKYRVREYRKEGATDQKLAEYFPERKGQRLDFIPFQFIGVDDTTPAVDDPPLLDLAFVNLSHYHTTADLEHGAHKTALPQPWVSGMQAETDAQGKPKPVVLYLGGGHAWLLPKDTQAGMLEYTGQGLAALETRAEGKERMMAVLGARMLEQQKKAQEAAETAGIHRSGEQSSLASQGATISRGLQQVLSWFDEWAGGDGAVTFTINDDFFPAQMTPEELTALVNAWQMGALSKEALFEKLQRGGVVSDGREFEDEETKIANAPPTLLAGAAEQPAEAVA